MAWISHKPCPMCDSSDAFSYNTGTKGGKCHACGQKYTKANITRPEIAAEFPVWEPDGPSQVGHPTEKPNAPSAGLYEALRGISAQTMEYFGVKTYEKGGEKEHHYVYPSGGVKIRKLPKEFRWSGGAQVDMFGMNVFPAGSGKVLTITEGELDAMSAWQMLGGDGKWTNPVVSLPSATPSSALWDNCFKWVDSFEKVILATDNDEAGKRIAQKIDRLFPGKVYQIEFGAFKDANEWLQKGKPQDFKSAWFNAKRYAPDNILNTEEKLLALYDAKTDFTFVPTGIRDLDDKISGLMVGHFTMLKAPTGIGKTELMRYLEYNFLQRGVKFASWHLEEPKLRSLLGLVSYELGDNLTRKDIIEDKGRDEDVRKAIKKIVSTGCYHQFYLKEDQTEDDLIQQIRLMKEAFDCKFVMFEPIQDVISDANESNKESRLASLSVRLSKLASELEVGIISIGHTNVDGDFKYCKMIGQRASVIISLHRDKEAEDVVDANTTKLKVEKNRPTSLEGWAGQVYFDLDTFKIEEM